MSPSERTAKAQRAQMAWDEFFAPMIGELRSAYSERMVEIANAELNRDKRADKITALSNAVRILSNLESGMQALITDGEVAARELAREATIENMTAPKRRLLQI